MKFTQPKLYARNGSFANDGTSFKPSFISGLRTL